VCSEAIRERESEPRCPREESRKTRRGNVAQVLDRPLPNSPSTPSLSFSLSLSPPLYPPSSFLLARDETSRSVPPFPHRGILPRTLRPYRLSVRHWPLTIAPFARRIIGASDRGKGTSYRVPRASLSSRVHRRSGSVHRVPDDDRFPRADHVILSGTRVSICECHHEAKLVIRQCAFVRKIRSLEAEFDLIYIRSFCSC